MWFRSLWRNEEGLRGTGKMSFGITGKESIVVYGAGERGKRFAELFCGQGFYVKAILDRQRIESVNIRGGGGGDLLISVVNPEEYTPDSKDEIVIISLLNGRLHDSVAQLLYQRGFEKMIYLPWKTENNMALMSDMRKIYNVILAGKCRVDYIPEYADIVRNSFDDSRIDTADVIYMPMESLFTAGGQQFGPENMINSERFFRLYAYLDKAEGNCVDYLKEQIADSPDACNERMLLKDRYELFEYFEKAYQGYREFFEDSAPWVIWNQHGYFQLEDGFHRTTFLLYKGMQDVPVRIREEDRQYIKLWKQAGGEFWCESPYLVNRASLRFSRKLNAIFCRAMLWKDVCGKIVYIKLNDAGLLGRYCYHLRCALCVDVENEETIDFAKKIKNIFRFSKQLEICMKAEISQGIDIAVMDEKYLDDEMIQANRYIIKMEMKGMLHNRLLRNKLAYEELGKIFDGEQRYLVIQIEGNELGRNVIWQAQ